MLFWSEAITHSATTLSGADRSLHQERPLDPAAVTIVNDHVIRLCR